MASKLITDKQNKKRSKAMKKGFKHTEATKRKMSRTKKRNKAKRESVALYERTHGQGAIDTIKNHPLYVEMQSQLESALGTIEVHEIQSQTETAIRNTQNDTVTQLRLTVDFLDTELKSERKVSVKREIILDAMIAERYGAGEATGN
jgi:hypothetical protein